MNKIVLRIADLRKKAKVTQQELAERIGVSFQTVSKWETGVNMPDITILPILSDYFKVSTDQLLGLKPLDDETYIPEKTATKEFWNQKLEYLLRTALAMSKRKADSPFINPWLIPQGSRRLLQPKY